MGLGVGVGVGGSRLWRQLNGIGMPQRWSGGLKRSLPLVTLCRTPTLPCLCACPPCRRPLPCVQHARVRDVLAGTALGVGLQAALGAPFLRTYPHAYLTRAFEFSRVGGPAARPPACPSARPPACLPACQL